jgi:hypothetical protein
VAPYVVRVQCEQNFITAGSKEQCTCVSEVPGSERSSTVGRHFANKSRRVLPGNEKTRRRKNRIHMKKQNRRPAKEATFLKFIM